ncbi:right-handed parallel beta-helix repeat-containing protein, partial [Marinicella sp. S1101]
FVQAQAAAAPSATITAPSPACTVQTGQTYCSTTIGWTATNAPNACVYVAGNSNPFSCSPGPNKTFNYAKVAGNTFNVHINNDPNSAILATIFVQAQDTVISQNCDVTIDQSQDIQTILDANLSATSTDICLSPGTYNIQNKLKLKDNQHLIGIGATPNDVVIKALNGFNHTRMMVMNGKDNVSVTNLTFDSNQIPFTFTVLVYNSTNVNLDNIVFNNLYETRGVGVKLGSFIELKNLEFNFSGFLTSVKESTWTNDSNDVLIDGVIVNGQNDGIFGRGSIACYRSFNYVVQNSVSIDSGGAGFYLNSCWDFEIKNNQINGGSEWGVDIVNGSHDGIVDNNIISNKRFGAMVIDDHSGAIGGAGQGKAPYNIVIKNNTMIGNNIGGTSNCSGVNVVLDSLNNGVDVQNSNSNNNGPLYCTRN